MAKRHYAPRATLVLGHTVTESDISGLTTPLGLLVHETPAADVVAAAQHVELLSPNPEEYGADLYAALHRLDDAGVRTIVAQRPPAGDEWLAVLDRLTRAAARST